MIKFCFVSAGHRSIEVLRGDSRNSGGAEAQLAHLAAALARHGHAVELCYGKGLAQAAPGIVTGVHCIDAFPSWKRPSSLLRFWNALWLMKPDVIYTRLPHDFLWLIRLFTTLHPETRFIYALANDRFCNPWQAYKHKKWFHNPLYALGLRMADIVAVQHEQQARMIRKHTGGKLILVPNLLLSTMAQPRNYDQADIDVIWIALIRPQKQLALLLDIAEKLPQLHFMIVGGFDGSLVEQEQRKLKDRINQLPNVHYAGSQNAAAVLALLKRSKILVNTSSHEGFPNTMLEAWSVGVPVVSLTVDPGGVIKRTGHGLVSKTIDTMVTDVALLVQTRSLNLEMGACGLNYVRQYHSFTTVRQALLEIGTA
jgi:glycosyltransferase involved in cell wall biosynthesis